MPIELIAPEVAPAPVVRASPPAVVLPAAQRTAWLARVSRGDVVAADLGETGAAALLDAALAGGLDEFELGALLFAWRAKGVSASELAGMMRVAQAHVSPFTVDVDAPIVLLPSYGAGRRGAALTPLLACLLADAGIAVLVHGGTGPCGSGVAETLGALGIGVCAGAQEARRAIARGDPAFVEIERFAPALASLLQRTARIGVASLMTLVARLLDPGGHRSTLRLAGFGSPATHSLLYHHLVASGANALLMRGCEGEVAADSTHCPQIDWLHDGRCETLVRSRRVAAGEQVPLPVAGESLASAQWVQSVLAGERPVPSPIAAQLAAVVHALRAGDAPGETRHR